MIIDFEECSFNNSVHLEHLASLINEYILDDMGGGEPLSALEQLRMVDGLNNHPAKYVVFVLVNNECAGLAVCFEFFSTFKAKPSLNIHDVFVRKPYRRKGVGAALLKHICSYAAEKKCASVTLEVREDNTGAQMLYIEEGFKPCDPNMLFWKKNIV